MVISKKTLQDISLLIIGFIISGCGKILDIEPPIQDITGSDIYKSNSSAASVLTGIYTDMSANGTFTGQTSISLRTGLSADELISSADPTSILSILYTNSLTNNGDQLFWTGLYSYIYRINDAIEGITSSPGITPLVKQQLIGEAKFLRAFMYFYLINLYGDVPLLTTTDLKINSTPSRTDKGEVYLQVIKDLKDAQALLGDEYWGPNINTVVTNRLRPNRFVATALLARVYLYVKEWKSAEAEATKIIDNDVLYRLETLDDVFKTTSLEAIWQLQPIYLGINTSEAITFVLAKGIGYDIAGPNGGGRPVYLSPNIFNAFEFGDARKINWTDSVEVSGVIYPFAYKYKMWEGVSQPRIEYLMVFRLAEQFLIRAEARAQQDKIVGPESAASDINAIRKRAGLSDIIAVSKEGMLDAILQERKVEFFTEWGHRWFDLKRTGKIDLVMSNVVQSKGGTWEAYKSLYPIPIQDIRTNPNLHGHQNPGYPEQ